MACTITIDAVRGITSGGTLTAITVEGTATGCSSVSVVLVCGLVSSTQPGVAVDFTGSWSTTFTSPPSSCVCGQAFAVTVECDDGVETCTAAIQGKLECEDEEPECPAASWSGFSLSDCNADGTTTVSVSATLTGTASYAAELRDSFGTVLDSVAGTGTLSLTGSDDYSGTVTFSVVIVAPSGCPGISLPLSLPDCPGCPEVDIDYEIGDCDEEANRTVTVTAEVTSSDSYTAELQDGVGTVLDTVSGSGTQTLSHTGTYAAGTSQTFSVVITSPSDCGATNVTIDIPNCCPDVEFDYEIGDCTALGRDITVTAQVSSPDSYTAELQDGVGTVLDTVSGSGTQTLSHTGTYPDGTSQTFVVVFSSPSGCGDAEVTIDIPDCEGCPEVDIDYEIGDCDEEANRTVTVTAEVTSSDSYTAELQDGVGTVLDTVSGSGTQTLSHTGTYAAGTSQTFSVVITSPSDCGKTDITIDVPECDETDNGESWGCFALRVLAAVALAIGILAALLALCVPAAASTLLAIAGAAGLIAVILGILYAIFCPDKPCQWLLLLTGQVLLGAGVSAMLLSACCTWLLWAGLGMAVVGALLLLWWRSLCGKSWCDLAKEVTYVIGGIVLPIVGIIAGIPVLVTCINGVALAVIGGIFGLIAVYAAACS